MSANPLAMVSQPDLGRGAPQVQELLGLQGQLSLRHFAEYAAEEGHRLRARDLERTSKGSKVMKANLARIRKQQLGDQTSHGASATDTAGREVGVQAGTMIEVLDRHLREFAVRELTEERSLQGLARRRRRRAKRLAASQHDQRCASRRGYAHAAVLRDRVLAWQTEVQGQDAGSHAASRAPAAGGQDSDDSSGSDSDSDSSAGDSGTEPPQAAAQTADSGPRAEDDDADSSADDGGATLDLQDSQGGRVHSKDDFAARLNKQWRPTSLDVGCQAVYVGGQRAGIGPGGLSVQFKFSEPSRVTVEGLIAEGGQGSGGPTSFTRRRARFIHVDSVALLQFDTTRVPVPHPMQLQLLMRQDRPPPHFMHYYKADGAGESAWQKCDDPSDNQAGSQQCLWMMPLARRQYDKLKSRWPDIAKHFGGSTPPRQLQDKTRTFQPATATGVEQDQAHAGLQVNVEPIASHQRSTIAYVCRLLDDRRPAGLQAIRELLAGADGPVTPFEVHTCIDRLLPHLVDDRRAFERECAEQIPAFMTRDAVAMDIADEEGEEDDAEEPDVGGLVVTD